MSSGLVLLTEVFSSPKSSDKVLPGGTQGLCRKHKSPLDTMGERAIGNAIGNTIGNSMGNTIGNKKKGLTNIIFSGSINIC